MHVELFIRSAAAKMQVNVNMKLAVGLWDDFTKDPTLNMCETMILHHLQKNGIQFEKNKRIIKPPPDIQDVFQEYWEPFIGECLHSALCLGFVVVTILEDDTGRSYPSVVIPHLYELHFTIQNNKYEYWLTSPYVDLDKTYIYTNFGMNPLPSGEIVSPVSRIMNHCRFLKELRFTTIIMEKNKSNPDYFSETVDTNKERHEGIDYDFYADASVEDPGADMQFDRSKKNVDVLMKQQELYHQYMGESSKQVKNLRNITQLPTGQHVVPTSQNTGRQDITQLHKVIQEEICSSMGVPRALMIGDSLFKSDTDGVTDAFKHTVLAWKKKLGYVFTDLYQKLYVDLKDLKVTKNIFTSKKKYQIVVTFPVHPNVTFEELDYLYHAGIIGWDTYSHHCLQNTSLPPELRELQPPAKPQDAADGSGKVDVSNVAIPNTKRKRSAR